MHGIRLTLAVLALALVVPEASGQKMHRLKDGRCIEARLKKSSKGLVLRTAFGERVIPKALYDGKAQTTRRAIETRYAQKVKALKKSDPKAVAELARWCRDAGYLSGLREQLNRILRLDPDHAWAREQLRSLAKEYRVHPAEKGKRGRDKRNVARFLMEVLAARDFVGAAIAAEKILTLPPEIAFPQALDALKHKDPRVRWAGARSLARHRDKPARINPLYKHALQDKAAAVRRESVRSLAVTKDPVFTKLFKKNLKVGHSGIRVNAAEALAEFGDRSALPALAQALADGGSAPRNHVALRTQRAYVKDFDVEIAQAAVIADPVVDTVSEGIILDVRVVGAQAEVRAMAGALRRLAGGGVDHGLDAAAWKRWIASDR